MSQASGREQLDRVRERFTRTADTFAGFSLAVRSAEAGKFVSLLAPGGNELALDLACGPGTFTLALAARVRHITGLDLTPALLAKARAAGEERGITNLSLACGNAYALPFASGTFDLATCAYTLHHLLEPPAMMRELSRVLRPGGRVALIDLFAPEEPARAEMNNRIERTRDDSHVRTLTASEFEILARAAEFRILRRELAERPRIFSDWTRIMGLQPGDPAFEETRQLMEASIENDSAGFHPRLLATATPGAPPDIEFVQRTLLLVVERI